MASAMQKAMKQMERERQKRNKKFEKKATPTTNDVLGIKSISDHNKKSAGEKLKFNMGSSWYFEKGYEKLILVGLCALGMWKLVGLIF